MSLDRREFLSGVLVSGLAAGAPAVHAQNKGKKFRLALIGCGWWGKNILHEAMDHGQCKVVALCDVDQRMLKQTRNRVRQRGRDAPKQYTDYRELLKREKPDLVINATPDHWHALTTIAAIEAGAHVYVEKPIGHTIQEGRAMVNAARANDRVVQVDLHRRASPHNQWAIDFMNQDKLGTVGMVRAFVHSSWGAGKPTEAEAPPKELDWDFWCGPAPKQPYRSSIHPKGFRQWLDYANGTAADWGVHWLDHIIWWSGQKGPSYVSSVGGRFMRETEADAPDTQSIHYTFDGFVAEWEHRLYAGNSPEKHDLGMYFYGTKGTLHVGWSDGASFYPVGENKPSIHKKAKLHKPDRQNIPELWADFIDAIRNNRRPQSDIESGHYSTNLSLLGMLSYKLGRGVKWDPDRERCVDDPEANALLRREYREPWQYPEPA